MRIGVIGVGKMGSHHARIFSEMKNVDLVGVADINETHAHAIAAEYNTRAFSDYRGLLDLKPDAVSIVVPTALHKAAAIDALDAGCHILVEKPISTTLEDGKQMIAKSHKVGKKMLVGHIERFNPAVSIMKDIIDAGELGEIVSITTKRVGPYSPRITDCGIILDLAPHDIDITSFLYGDRVREVYTIAGRTFHTYEDHATIMLRFRNGNPGVIETSWLPPHRVRQLNVIGTHGVASLDYLQQKVVVYDKNWSREANVTPKEPLRNELEYFIKLISNGDSPIVTGEDSLHALIVALTAVESYQAGKLLKVPPLDFAEPKAGKANLRVVRQ